MIYYLSVSLLASFQLFKKSSDFFGCEIADRIYGIRQFDDSVIDNSNPQTVAIKTVNSIIIYRILIINTIGIIIYSGLAHEI